MTTSKESLPDSNSPLEGWVRQVLPKALGFARSLTGDPYLAEDIVQDCLYRLLAKRDRYDLARDGWKILLRAITNAVVDEHRRRGARIGTAVEDESRRDTSDDAVARGVMAQPNRRGMAVDVAEKRLLAAVLHLDRTTGRERE